jgi:hypothetical protein
VELDLSQAKSLASPRRSSSGLVNSELISLTVLLALGCSPTEIDKARRRKPFQISGQEYSCNPLTGCGGFKNGATYGSWFHLYASLLHGGDYKAARRAIDDLEWLALVSDYKPRTQEYQPPEQPEDTKSRLSNVQPVKRMGAQLWCLRQKPITFEALEAHGAFSASWFQFNGSRYGQPVIGIPSYSVHNWQQRNSQIFPAGKAIEYRDPDNGFEPEYRKCMAAEGKQHDDSLLVSAEGLEWLRRGEPIENLAAVRVEGPKDLLAAWTIAQSADRPVLCLSNLYGARTLQLVDPVLKRLAKIGCRTFYCVGDRDEAGVAGAAHWYNAAIKLFDSRNLQLPLEYRPTKGLDLRDWATEKPRSWMDLVSLKDAE